MLFFLFCDFSGINIFNTFVLKISKTSLLDPKLPKMALNLFKLNGELVRSILFKTPQLDIT